MLRKGTTGSSGARARGDRGGILQYRACRCTLKMSRPAKMKIPDKKTEEYVLTNSWDWHSFLGPLSDLPRSLD